MVGVAALEIVGAACGLTPWGATNPLCVAPDSDLQESVSALVGAAVAIAATLLGLYYTTVGVIASTIYRAVPGDVRDLFIAERSSEAYLRVVVLTIAGGIVILVSGTFDHAVVGLSLLVLGLFVAMACIGLVVITKRLFDYFDPSKLSGPLLAQIAEGIRVATHRKTRADAHRSSQAHYETYRALASFRHLVETLESAELRSANAPVSLSRQLLEVVRYYSARKYMIPTDSNWWDRVPTHQNWLTIDHNRLQTALRTSTGVAPELQPDYLWLENTVARLLRQSLAVAFQSQAGANALAISESVANLAGALAARLQIDEALAIEASWDQVIDRVTTTPSVAAPQADEYELRLNQMAAAESLVTPLTQMLLGIAYAARAILERDLSAEFDAAVGNPDALYLGDLPTPTRTMLERFSAAIRREIQIEGRRVTPSWWINHLGARSMVEALLATESGILREVRRRTTERVARFQREGRSDLAAVTGMAALELLHKIEFHEPVIRKAEAKLATYRNVNIGIDHWPQRSESPLDPTDEHMAMLRTLSELLPELRSQRFNPREPDLYGQLYQFVVDGAFRAILGGHQVRGLAMYKAVLDEMDQARVRIVSDLDRLDAAARDLRAIEPFITAMDLSGYALLMHEFDGAGIWAPVKRLWDELLTANPKLAEFLLIAATYASSSVEIERIRRLMELNRLFEERGITRDEQHYWNVEDERRRPHPSPIVSAFAPNGFGITNDLYMLFIAEYLKDHLPPGASLGHRVEMVADQIARYRTQSSESENVDGGDHIE
ncbi:hypothetical protein ACFO6V_07205 [Promicromonospora alba]|uniref:DUF2254 domain-containing protein n=1 Tax=Promicromonospora alba TaxID=1616110 RepID=A0ABV9HCM6_9MICO